MASSEIVSAAAAAWERVKDASDPSFSDCALTHRANLIHQAESAARLRSRGEATRDPSAFESAVEAVFEERAKAEAEAAPAAEAPASVDPPDAKEDGPKADESETVN